MVVPYNGGNRVDCSLATRNLWITPSLQGQRCSIYAQAMEVMTARGATLALASIMRVPRRAFAPVRPGSVIPLCVPEPKPLEVRRIQVQASRNQLFGR
jgi:hypothetical protein